MIVAHLIGGNEIKGINKGIVIINDIKLDVTYQELVQVCGNISLGDLNTSITALRTPKHVQRDYIELVQEFDDSIEESFIIDNHLTDEVSYSEYEIDFDNKSLVLKISTYN